MCNTKNNTNTPPGEVCIHAHPIYLGQELLILLIKKKDSGNCFFPAMTEVVFEALD